MKERPILFSGEMVRAILDRRKTQTRQVVRGVGAADYAGATWVADGDLYTPARDELCRGCLDAIGPAVRCPYGAPGDRLWVKEAFALSIRDPDSAFEPDAKGPSRWDGAVYRATYSGGDWENYAADGTRTKIAPPWRPSIHMPRWASRITLEVTDVRVERLQDITPEDVQAEGMHGDYLSASARDLYASLWDRINGKRAPWASSPWVWVVSFRRVER